MKSCKDGKCGKCPSCEQKKSLMAMGYSEQAVEAVMFEFGEREIMEMVKTRLQVMHGLVRQIEESIAMNPGKLLDQWMIDKLTSSAEYLSAVADNAKFGDGLDDSPYAEKKGLWYNIHQKRKRIKAGSGERMRKPGSKGAPSAADLKSADTDGKKKK